MTDAPLSHLARSGTEFAVRVTPRAGKTAVTEEGGMIRVWVTEAPTDGRATIAVRDALAKALGVAKTRLTLVRGAASRDKRFRLE